MSEYEDKRVYPEAVLVEPEHRRLYLTSASFRAGVDFCCQQVIPTLLLGLAARAESDDRVQREAMLALMHASPFATNPNSGSPRA